MSNGVWRNALGQTLEELKAAGAEQPDTEAERADGLDAGEGAVMDGLNDVAMRFARLPAQHPSELRSFIDAISRAQGLLAIRAARRAYPDGWPSRT